MQLCADGCGENFFLIDVDELIYFKGELREPPRPPVHYKLNSVHYKLNSVHSVHSVHLVHFKMN